MSNLALVYQNKAWKKPEKGAFLAKTRPPNSGLPKNGLRSAGFGSWEPSLCRTEGVQNRGPRPPKIKSLGRRPLSKKVWVGLRACGEVFHWISPRHDLKHPFDPFLGGRAWSCEEGVPLRSRRCTLDFHRIKLGLVTKIHEGSRPNYVHWETDLYPKVAPLLSRIHRVSGPSTSGI